MSRVNGGVLALRLGLEVGELDDTGVIEGSLDMLVELGSRSLSVIDR